MRAGGPADLFHNASVDGVAQPFATANGRAVSGTSVYRSSKLDIKCLPDGSADFYWTGTPTGTFTPQVSNKPLPNELTDADWKTLTLSAPMNQPAGAAGGDTVDLAGLPFRWVRWKYTNASGSGTIECWAVAKGV